MVAVAISAKTKFMAARRLLVRQANAILDCERKLCFLPLGIILSPRYSAKQTAAFKPIQYCR